MQEEKPLALKSSAALSLGPRFLPGQDMSLLDIGASGCQLALD